VAERDELRAAVAVQEQALIFFASVIKSGEPWTPECEQALRKALDGETADETERDRLRAALWEGQKFRAKLAGRACRLEEDRDRLRTVVEALRTYVRWYREVGDDEDEQQAFAAYAQEGLDMAVRLTLALDVSPTGEDT
jgi:hypothetical protein